MRIFAHIPEEYVEQVFNSPWVLGRFEIQSNRGKVLVTGWIDRNHKFGLFHNSPENEYVLFHLKSGSYVGTNIKNHDLAGLLVDDIERVFDFDVFGWQQFDHPSYTPEIIAELKRLFEWHEKYSEVV